MLFIYLLHIIHFSEKIVWASKKRATEDDQSATLLLLQLRQKYSYMFEDKKQCKIQLWKEIAQELIKAGYVLVSVKEAAERCRQKLANLQKIYTIFVKKVKETGAAREEKPQFYKELHSILGQKDKISPPYLLDSLLQSTIEP